LHFFLLSFANCAILQPPLFSNFAPYLLPIVFCSKSSLKEGKWGKRLGAKSLKKKEGCKITQLAKRQGGKVQLNTRKSI